MSVSGTHKVVFNLHAHGEDIEREITSELDVLAQTAAARMRELVTKGVNSHLVQSIRSTTLDKLTREIGPNMDYAEFVERGIKPGGKGLPKFDTTLSIVRWLESKAFSGQSRVRLGTGRFTARELLLRDRYEGLAWHIRHKGTKARPFVEPTAKEMESVTLRKLDLAVRRVLAKRPDTPGDGALA